MDIIRDEKYMADVPQSEIRSDMIASNGKSTVQKLYIPTANLGVMTEGEYYGQIDIRDSSSGFIIVQDSTSFSYTH